MTEQKKYTSIVRLGHKSTIGIFNVGDPIVIQEKIDGANASFKGENGKVLAFSRNNLLDESNNLGGFYQWVQENIRYKDLVDDAVYFGEWTNPHKVKYPLYQKQFFLYDIYDFEFNEYIQYEIVERVAKNLGLNFVPVFYDGEYISFEHLQSFVGKTALGGMLGDVETGEGIVVRNHNYTDRFGNQVFVKLVTDAFREVQKQKAPKDPKQELTQEQVFVNQVVTDARLEKFLYKFVDEGILEAPFGIEDMGVILKNMTPRVVADILEEESELLPTEYDTKALHKAVSRTVAQSVKKILIKG